MSSRSVRRPGWSPTPARRALAAWLAVTGLLLVGRPVVAHEYWLDPLDATIGPGDPIMAAVRNGEDYVGSAYPFDPARFSRAELVGPDGRQALTGRLGDYPALRAAASTAGLHLLVLEAGVKPLAYDEMSAFEEFLDYHGLIGVAERHAERGLPSDTVLELYSRHATAFIDVQAPDAGRVVADSPPALAAQGLDYELVLDADPYARADTVVRALFDGQAQPDVQIEMFARLPDGSVTRVVQRSDDEGRARFDTAPVADYLFNSVHLVEAEPPGAHWRSYWAALTLERSRPVDGPGQ